MESLFIEPEDIGRLEALVRDEEAAKAEAERVVDDTVGDPGAVRTLHYHNGRVHGVRVALEAVRLVALESGALATVGRGDAETIFKECGIHPSPLSDRRMAAIIKANSKVGCVADWDTDVQYLLAHVAHLEKTLAKYATPCCCSSCGDFADETNPADPNEYSCWCDLDQDGDIEIEDVFRVHPKCPKLMLNRGKAPECAHRPAGEKPPEPFFLEGMDLTALRGMPGVYFIGPGEPLVPPIPPHPSRKPESVPLASMPGNHYIMNGPPAPRSEGDVLAMFTGEVMFPHRWLMLADALTQFRARDYGYRVAKTRVTPEEAREMLIEYCLDKNLRLYE